MSHTRAEWTYAHFGIMAAGGVSVSVYQTNSADECHYVLEHSESEVVFLEDAEQLEKIRKVRDKLPKLRQIVLFEPVEGADDAITLDELRERGRGRDAAEVEARTAAVTKDDVCIFIYTSGTTGPPKCCILSHGNYRDVVSMSEEQGVVDQGEVVYLFLPLAHAFAKLVQFLAIDLGARAGLLGEGSAEDHPQPDGDEADVLPVGAPDLREDLHAGHVATPRTREKLRAGGAGGRQGPPDEGRGPGGPGRARRPASTRPRRSCSPTCATSSAAGSGSATRAPRRSPRRSSSSSTPAACR